ncbi:hypothetical protein [Leifsonia poae]|uniref:hypothetical protein n=1 Tax=Leifsonia poae TaxID=110933 RepID=UPI001CBC53D3|nr:hypothetical protein [Leifsonia poae]
MRVIRRVGEGRRLAAATTRCYGFVEARELLRTHYGLRFLRGPRSLAATLPEIFDVARVRQNDLMDASLPPILEELAALVVPATFSGDVCWDRQDKQWLAEDHYSTGWRVQKVPAGDSIYHTPEREPHPETLQKAVEVAEAFKNSRYICEWCGIRDLGSHVILPDIYGEPAVLCLLRPDPTTVNSHGGGGEKKHWAFAVDACPSVKYHENRAPGEYYGPLVSVDLYGEALTTMEALERRWCSKCQSAAWTQRANRQYELESALGRDATPDELRRFEKACNRDASERQLLRYLRTAMEARGIDDVREVLRDTRLPLTAQQYIDEQERNGWIV